MNDKKRRRDSSGHINADVFAVGTARTAAKIVGGDPRITTALYELRGAIERLSLTPQQKELVGSNLAQIEQASKQGDTEAARSGLQILADKLQMAGVVVKETLALAGPLGTLAGLSEPHSPRWVCEYLTSDASGSRLSRSDNEVY